MSFETCLNALLVKEGLYSNDPDDHPTKYGITEITARAHGYLDSMEDLTLEAATVIYNRAYWKPLWCDEISQHWERLAEELFDSGVNCGVGRVASWLQRALNALNQGYYEPLIVDGHFGVKTHAALKAYLAKRGVVGERVLVRMLNGFQCVHYVEVVENNPNKRKFIFGWVSNRVQ